LLLREDIRTDRQFRSLNPAQPDDLESISIEFSGVYGLQILGPVLLSVVTGAWNAHDYIGHWWHLRISAVVNYSIRGTAWIVNIVYSPVAKSCEFDLGRSYGTMTLRWSRSRLRRRWRGWRRWWGD